MKKKTLMSWRRTVRNFKSVPSVALRWNYPLMIHAPDLDPTKLRKTGRGAQFTDKDVIETLAEGGTALGHRGWPKLIAARFKVDTPDL